MKRGIASGTPVIDGIGWIGAVMATIGDIVLVIELGAPDALAQRGIALTPPRRFGLMTVSPMRCAARWLTSAPCFAHGNAGSDHKTNSSLCCQPAATPRPRARAV